jgi:hypothetical protein
MYRTLDTPGKVGIEKARAGKAGKARAGKARAGKAQAGKAQAGKDRPGNVGNEPYDMRRIGRIECQ